MAGVDKAKFVELLKALNSEDKTIRQAAETMYAQAKTSEPDNIMLGMMLVLASPDVDEAIKRHDCVLLRQLMMRGSEKDFVFSRIALANKQAVASELLVRFESEPLPKLQKKIGEIVSKLAEYVCDPDDTSGSLAPGTNGWPALLPKVFTMGNAASAQNLEACECALRLLRDVVPTLKKDIVAAKTELGAIIQNGIAHANLKIKTATVLVVCEIVECVEKKDWVPLLATANVITQVMMQLARANEEDLLSECMQELIEVARIEPDFFKKQLTEGMEPANFMAGVARSREVADTGLRNLALEWLTTYLEKRIKWLSKNLPAFAPLVLQACMDMMIEIDDGAEEVQAWADRLYDEEGDEDEDELFHAGEEAIDRVVEAATMEVVAKPLFQLIQHFSSQPDWQAKHAALAAVKQTVEYVDEHDHVDELTKLLVQHCDHPHPRVRYTALHAIGQMANDQAPYFQEKWHKEVMPVMLLKMDDAVDRVAAMAMSAFVSFGEELDKSLMQTYSQQYMTKLVAKLQATQHRGLREESITSIAVIAGVIEKDFAQYYDGIMPLLKQIVMNATNEKENRLRGKAFECMSLLGVAVGKEKFLPDAGGAITEMLKSEVAADDVQREYIKEASERICQCLKKDFAPFLPNLLQGIYKSLSLEDCVADTPNGAPGGDDDDDDEFVSVLKGDGKLVKVRTSKFEEMTQSAQLLNTFCMELEGAFFDWVKPTAEALLPLLDAADEVSYLCDEVRGLALQTWGLLIKSARTGAAERGLGNDIARELLHTGLQKTFSVLEKNEDPEMLSETATGILECVTNVGQGGLTAEEVPQLVNKMFVLMDQSIERSNVGEKRRQDMKAQDAQCPQIANDEENEDKDDESEQEEQLRRNYEGVLGAIMQVAPQFSLACLQTFGQRIQGWISTKTHKVLAIYLACDLIQHLKEQSQPTWPLFMAEVFSVLGEKDEHDARTAAAYCINLAAPLASFDEAAPDAFKRLCAIVGGTKPKKRAEKALMAWDNAVAALLTLASTKSNLCPPDIGAANAWSLIANSLPLKCDEEEAKKVHDKVVDLVLAQDAGLLGGEQRGNLGKILSVLAEVHHQETLCTKETEAKIEAVFKALPREILQACAPTFTEKQQKKIESICMG